MKTITTLAALALTLLTCGCSEINSILAVANVGREGPAGQDGRDGVDGAQGPKGEPGIQGPKGWTGPAGPQGAQGQKGDPGPNNSMHKSGTRLKAIVWTGMDGSQQFAGFHDEELGVDCEYSIEKGNDSQNMRCYPTTKTETYEGEMPNRFDDDQCKVHVVTVDPTYAYARSTVLKTVWTIEPREEGAQSYKMVDGECVEVVGSSGSKLVKANSATFVRAEKMPAPDQP